MSDISPAMRTVVYVTLMTFLAGCAAPGGNTGQGEAGGGSDPCNMAGALLIGAILGGVVGAATGNRNRAAAGAAVGAAAGAALCVGINVNSRQTKSAAQADRDYKQGRGYLPSEPQVVSYTPRLSAQTVQRGKPIQLQSSLEVVNGSVNNVEEVREEVVVYNQEGQPIKTGSKPFTSNSGGRFENSFDINLGQNASQGAYPLKTNLYVNGQLKASRNLNAQLVWFGDSGLVVALQ